MKPRLENGKIYWPSSSSNGQTWRETTEFIQELLVLVRAILPKEIEVEFNIWNED